MQMIGFLTCILRAIFMRFTKLMIHQIQNISKMNQQQPQNKADSQHSPQEMVLKQGKGLTKPQQVSQQIKKTSRPVDTNEQKSQADEQEIPEHFYDSDIASVYEKDFMSDNQPPKDIVQERKLLYKEKLLHVFKTIIRVGTGIDKPARYDRIKIKHKQVPRKQIVKQKRKDEKVKIAVHKEQQKVQSIEQQKAQSKGQGKEQSKAQLKDNEEKQSPKEQSAQLIAQKVEKQQASKDSAQQLIQTQEKDEQPLSASSLPPYYSTSYVQSSPVTQYNIGNQKQQIQRLVTSMKRGQTALFQLQHLTVSKKSNIKIKQFTQVHVIHSIDWMTVIDLDGDKKLLKEVLRRGEGAFRVANFDKISCSYRFQRNEHLVQERKLVNKRLQKQCTEIELPRTVWRVLTSMKDQQSVKLDIQDEDLKQVQSQQFYSSLQRQYVEISQPKQTQEQTSPLWSLFIQITQLTKVDDIHLDGRILKQTIEKGVSTAKPASSSLVYYALKFINDQQQVLKQDQCFDSDWWQDFGKLEELKGIRKSHLDDYGISKMLRKAIKRMKPAEVALVQCRDKDLFKYGSDFEETKALLNFEEAPQSVKLIVRIYNFTQARTAFNMEIQEKIVQSKRKKQIAIRLLSQNRIPKALKKFENIIAFYSSQLINQQAYDEKTSALMNAILCHMKTKKYPQVLNLCNQILLKPRHGYLSKDIKIVGPGHAKIQETSPKNQDGTINNQQEVKNGDTRRIATDLTQNQKIIDKCLYRKAFALVEMGECQDALKCLGQMSEPMTSTQEVIKLKKQATKGKQKYEQKSKKIFKSMFG